MDGDQFDEDRNLTRPSKRRSTLTQTIRKLSDTFARGGHHELDEFPEAPETDMESLPGSADPNAFEVSNRAYRAKSDVSGAAPVRKGSALTVIAALSAELETEVLRLVAEEEKNGAKALDIEAMPARLQELFANAERGIARAQFSIGAYFHLGGSGSDSVPINHLQALKWYTRSATIGDVASINNIGVMLMKGLGVKQNEEMAVKFLEYSVNSGNVYGMVNLGILLTKPTDPAVQDFQRSFPLFYRAAKLGNTIAQNNLGCMLARGYGCEKDEKKSMKYFRRSADGGSAAAKYNVGVLYQNGWGTRADFSVAKEWFDAACADPKHEEYPYVVADNDPTKFLLLTSIISYRP